MKSILFTLLISFTLAAGGTQKDISKVTIQLDRAFIKESQWCYISGFHVIGTDLRGMPNKRIQGLGIKSIPANFLLDREQRIIAKNLYGEQLVQTLDSLMQQSTIPMTEKDNEYDKILAKVYYEDQAIRLKIDSLMNIGYPDMMELYSEMSNKDLENQKIVIPILERYLKKEIELQDKSLEAIYIVIQHADFDIQHKYRSFIKHLYQKSIISNVDYARFIDRWVVRQNKAQLVGCQSAMNQYTQDPFPYPLQVSDSIRKELNMLDIKRELDSLFVNEYAPLYIEESEYVVFGNVMDKIKPESSYTGIENVELSINGALIRTNKNGFYAIKIKKSDFPLNIAVQHEEKKRNFILEMKNDSDWQILNIYLDEIQGATIINSSSSE